MLEQGTRYPECFCNMHRNQIYRFWPGGIVTGPEQPTWPAERTRPEYFYMKYVNFWAKCIQNSHMEKFGKLIRKIAIKIFRKVNFGPIFLGQVYLGIPRGYPRFGTRNRIRFTENRNRTGIGDLVPIPPLYVPRIYISIQSEFNRLTAFIEKWKKSMNSLIL